MEIQPTPVPLANPGSSPSRSDVSVQGVRSDDERAVENADAEERPRFPFPDPDKGRNVDLEV